MSSKLNITGMVWQIAFVRSIFVKGCDYMVGFDLTLKTHLLKLLDKLQGNVGIRSIGFNLLVSQPMLSMIVYCNT